jgi:hypothetical protein
MFFEEYFKNRGESIEPNTQNEVQVRCPFPHDNGHIEKNASASFNIKRRIYKCFTCAAEDRELGMSETAFISKVFETTYDNAVKLRGMLIKGGTENLAQATKNLLHNDAYKKKLNDRGITDEAIVEYNLGFTGDGIIYPVIIHGLMFDTRTYNPNPQEGEPKVRSLKGAKPLLFPYDKWMDDPRPTLLCGGENDTLLARIKGFNAIEGTGGEGGIPKILMNKFKGKKVYIAYDCDKAGRDSSMRIAYYLREVKAEVYLVDLGLPGTKDNKDITDYFMKNGKTSADLQLLMDNAPAFTDEQYIEQKNKEFQLVDLWNVKKSQYSDRYISSRVIQMGHFEVPTIDVPSYVEWECRGSLESKVCESCPFHVQNKSGEWILGDDNLGDVLNLVEVTTAQQDKAIKRLCNIPEKCPNSRVSVIAKKHIERVLLSPDVETENESSGYKAGELHAYVIDGDTEDGNKYRMYFKRFPHPKDQSLIMVVDRVEDSDNAINSFKVTPEFMDAMKVWQGDPYTIMKKRYEELGKVAVGKYLPESIFYSSEIIYHSVLDFWFMDRYMKGHPEGLIVGASRTGKSEVGVVMSNFYGLGNVTEVKNSSVAGLIGGVDKSANGTFKISWGEIPRNHRGMLFLDEISGIHPDVFKHLTGVRSQRVATISKIRKGNAPAKTRLLWVGNPKTNENGRSRSLYDYNSGVDVCLDLFPADEDVSRFDFIVLVPEPAEYISPLNPDGTLPEDKQLPEELKQLIRWAWSRNKDQVKFDPYVEQYIEHTAIELNKDFGSSVKIIGVEGVKKIARIATSIASCCFSTDSTGECVVVKKEHVDWVRDFLIRCYDNDIFQLKQFVANERKFSTITDDVVKQTATLVKKYPMIIKLLLENELCPAYNIQAVGGIAGDEYRHLINIMSVNGLVHPQIKGFSATRRLKLAIDQLTMKKKKSEQIDAEKPKSFSDKINLR